jgi:predicted transposase/invertase (TIGR01784 family)
MADLLQYMLPKDLIANLDIQSLELENTSYTDNDLRQHFSDLVYTCRYREHKIKVSLLFEHKSKPDGNLPIQLNRYLTCIWNEQIKQQKNLEPIVPIVLYHGRQQWKPSGIAACFAWSDAKLLRYTPAFDYHFIDLSKYSLEAIKHELFDLASVKIALMVLKYIFNPNTLEKSLSEFFEVGRAYFEDAKGLIFSFACQYGRSTVNLELS